MLKLTCRERVLRQRRTRRTRAKLIEDQRTARIQARGGHRCLPATLAGAVHRVVRKGPLPECDCPPEKLVRTLVEIAFAYSVRIRCSWFVKVLPYIVLSEPDLELAVAKLRGGYVASAQALAGMPVDAKAVDAVVSAATEVSRRKAN